MVSFFTVGSWEKDTIFGAARKFFGPYFCDGFSELQYMERLIYTDYVIFGSEKFLILQSMYLSPQILNNFDCSISKYFHGNIFLDWVS